MNALFLANMGVPMISVFLPLAWLALLPIILIEAGLGKWMTKTPLRQSLFAATLANLFSTLLGVPLTWLAFAVTEGLLFERAEGLDSFAAKVYAVTVQSPWLIPYEENLSWMIPIAFLVLSVPLWFMSVVSEYLIVRRVLPSIPAAAAWRWMWKGNAASYLFLVSLPFILPWLNPPLGWLFEGSRPVSDLLIQAVLCLCRLVSGTG